MVLLIAEENGVNGVVAFVPSALVLVTAAWFVTILVEVCCCRDGCIVD